MGRATWEHRNHSWNPVEGEKILKAKSFDFSRCQRSGIWLQIFVVPSRCWTWWESKSICLGTGGWAEYNKKDVASVGGSCYSFLWTAGLSGEDHTFLLDQQYHWGVWRWQDTLQQFREHCTFKHHRFLFTNKRFIRCGLGKMLWHQFFLKRYLGTRQSSFCPVCQSLKAFKSLFSN